MIRKRNILNLIIGLLLLSMLNNTTFIGTIALGFVAFINLYQSRNYFEHNYNQNSEVRR